MNLTKEQQKIINEVITNKDGIYSIEAVAGSGKSFTIFQMIEKIKSKEPNAKILYIVFNKSNQISAQGKLMQYELSSNPVVVKTCNSYAHSKWMRTIGNFEVINGLDKDTIHKFTEQSKNPDIKYSKHRPFKELLNKFESSKLLLDSFCEDMEFHFDDEYIGPDKPKDCEVVMKSGRTIIKYGIPVDCYSVITKAHIATFKKIIEHYKNNNQYTHGMYMKAAAYSKSEKTSGDEWDYVFFDEAQDANCFVLKLLQKQKIKKLYFVGDRRQSIYNFGGINENVFETYKFDKKYKLSKSFRYGKQIANIANIILDDNSIKVVGTEQDHEINSRKLTRLYRTNAKLFKDALDLSYQAVKANISLKIDFMRTSNSNDSKINDEMLAFLGLFYKYTDPITYRKYESIISNTYKSEILQIFEQRLKDTGKFYNIYNEMYDFLSDDLHDILKYAKDDTEFISKLKALENCKNMFSADYEIIMCTMHRSKGLEWDNVVISEPTKLFYEDKDGNLHKNSDWQQELNLSYVACTRSRKNLDASILLDELDMFGIDTKENSFVVKC